MTFDANDEYFQEVEVKEYYGIFTESRLDKDTIPDGVNCYELRHDDDDDSYPATLEKNVLVNYFGTVLTTDDLDTERQGLVHLSHDDFGFTDEELTLSEYLAKYKS